MDTFSKEYIQLSDDQKAAVINVKNRAEDVEDLYNKALTDGGDPRLVATAKTYLEISVMLAVKAITRRTKQVEAKDQA